MHNSADRDDFNCTRVEFFDEENSLGKNSSDNSITVSRVDLNNFKDLTSQHVDNFVLQEHPQFQEISYKNAFLPGQQPSSFILPNLELSQMMRNEMSLGNIQDMSDKPSTSKQQTFRFDSTASNDNMDFTQAIPTNFANLHLSKLTNAEITRSIPPNSNLMRQILNAKRQAEQNATVLLNTTQKSDFEMNVTECVSTSAKNKRQTIIFNEVDLDITNTVNSTSITVDANKENIPQNLEEIEITQAIPANVNQLIKSRRQTINYNTENIENNGMEITEVISQGFNYFTNTNARKIVVLPNRSALLLQDNYALQDGAEAKKENIPTSSKITENCISFNTQSFDNIEIEDPEINNENMEMTTAIYNNMQQKNNHETIYFNLQNDELVDMNIENMEVTIANSNNMQQENPAKKRQTINFKMQNEGNMDITKINKNLQHISDMGIINTENMELSTAINNKFNMQQKNTVKNLQNEESDVDISNTINLQQISRLAEDIEVTTANSSKTVQQKNPSQNRQTFHFKTRHEEEDITKMNEKQISDLSIINNKNMEILHKNILQPKNKTRNRHTINFKQIFESANTDMAQDVPCAINVQLLNEISARVEDDSKVRYSSVVKEKNNAENLTNNSTINQKEQLFGSTEINSNSTVKQENIELEMDDYPAPINFVTKKPCSSYIRRTMNLQADKSMIIIDSTALKIVDDKNNTFHLNNINNDCASSIQVVSLDESYLKRSPNNTKDSLKNITELSETKIVLNQIADLLKEKNVNDSMEGVAKDTSEMVTEKIETIFHFKGYPLVVNQAANESGKSDICQRIKYLEETQESFHRSKLNFTSYSNPNSCNISKNLSSFVDNTEKLINYKPELVGTSDYTKIINKEIVLCNISSKRTSLESVDELANVPHKVNIIESNITSHFDNIIEIQDDKTTESVGMSNTNNVLSSNSIISINSSSDNDSAQKDDSFANELEYSDNSNNETLWRSVVQKSKCYNSEMLSSLDISLVNSSDTSQTPDQFEVSNINTVKEKQYKKPARSVSDIFNEQMKIIKNKYAIPKPKVNIIESNRSAYSIKQLNPTNKQTEVEPEIVTVDEQIKQKRYKFINIL